MNTLAKLQHWYLDQCNGEWEHLYGIGIENLDNPGWIFTVDLTGTYLAEIDFDEFNMFDDQDENNWMACQ